MRTLYLDCFAGISGDMFLGALLDAGLDFDHLREELKKLPLEGYQLEMRRVDRSGITATKFDVHLAHSHEHHHAHVGLTKIKGMIESSALSDSVKQRAVAIFQRLGEAEARIHNMAIDDVQFHEVGAVDSIVDIVGASIGLETMGIANVITSPLRVGTGTLTCSHGVYPVPGPAAAALLRGFPVYAGEIEGEMVTPTGAALVSTVAKGCGPMPRLRVERIGYGAGTREYPRFPNVLRVFVGDVDEESTPATVTVIEANIDDLNAQVFGNLMDEALAAGALDLFYTPVQMKKNRPGVLLTLLCAPEDREKMAALIFRETTTLGVRYREEQRMILGRERVTVETSYGPIRIKVASNDAGEVLNYAPEFEDCRAAAAKSGVAVRQVQNEALAAYSANARSRATL
jgi:pyridinium-3,5-bisthiocarboxylic acid mononucleotide nickel chelatase